MGNQRFVCLMSFLCLLFASLPVAAQLTLQDYRDALTLRERWEYLTRDVAFPAHWVEKTHDFVYRKTVRGGFAFIRENADTAARRRASTRPVSPGRWGRPGTGITRPSGHPVTR